MKHEKEIDRQAAVSGYTLVPMENSKAPLLFGGRYWFRCNYDN